MGEVLERAIEMSRPDICLYDAGVDPHAEDDLGRLSLSSEGLYRRDKLVRHAPHGFHIKPACTRT